MAVPDALMAHLNVPLLSRIISTQGIGHRHITLLCETGDDVVVCEIIIIVVVVAYVEKSGNVSDGKADGY